ncbi:MAG: hypothetical protein JRJ85_11335 [Deltaproteobacteria bacterium]|nr:hypothetical protein [Deltaproteobacteria bacterium]
MYDNQRDANLYLHNSYVKYNGNPAFVRRVDEDMVVDIIDMVAKERKDIPIEQLDLSPFKLGYFFYKRRNRTLYIERMPIRAWRRGLTRENLRIRNSDRGFLIPHNGSNDMLEILAPDYLPINLAYARAKENNSEYPFHRMFSIDLNGLVRYKTVIVGGYGAEEGIVLVPNYKWLKELAEGSV